MPIYEYRCDKGHKFELFQSMSESSLTKCVECGADCERVLSAPAVHFKGSGFYTTDYARKGAQKAAGDGDSSASDSEKSSSDKGSSSEASTSKASAAEKSSSSGSGSNGDKGRGRGE